MRRKTPYPAVFANIVATMAEALIADAGHNKVAYLDDYTATTLSWLGTAGSGPGQWRAPRAVTSCGAGFLIADTGNHRIVSIDGADGSGWQALGNHGTAQGQFDQPTGLAVDSEGRIYIADSGNARVVRVDGIDGSGWVSFGTAGAPTPTDPAVGKFRQPTGLAVDGNDDLWIADWECSRMVKIAGMDGTGWFAVRVDSPVAIAQTTTMRRCWWPRSAPSGSAAMTRRRATSLRPRRPTPWPRPRRCRSSTRPSSRSTPPPAD